MSPEQYGSRRAIRSLERLGEEAALEVARMRAIESIEIAKIEAVGAATRVALAEAANISLLEALHAERVPHAAGRLRLIADSGTAAIAHQLVELNRALR